MLTTGKQETQGSRTTKLRQSGKLSYQGMTMMSQWLEQLVVDLYESSMQLSYVDLALTALTVL